MRQIDFKKYDMEQSYSNKQIWKVSYPIILSLLAQNVINLTDTAFLGRVSEIALGAAALGGLYYICLFTVGFGFSVGSQIVVARRNGQKQHQEIGAIVLQGIIFLQLLALLFYALSVWLGKDIMTFIISSDQVLDATMEFLHWRVFGFFFAFINVMFRAFYIGIARTKVMTLNAVVMAIVNIILDYALIFGNFGFPELGIKGAAIASVIAELSSVLFFIIYTITTVDLKKYGFQNYQHVVDIKQLKAILKISSFTMLQYFLSMGSWFIFFMAVERLGQRELAIANIVRSIYILMLIPVNSLSTTANSLVSNLIGEGGVHHVEKLIRKIAKVSLFIMIGLILLVVIWPEPIIRIYTNSDALIEGAIPSLYIISIAMLIASVSNIVFNSISGTGNTQAALWLEIITLIFYSLYIIIVGLVLKASLEICFTVELVYYSLLLIVSLIYFKKAKWQNKTI